MKDFFETLSAPIENLSADDCADRACRLAVAAMERAIETDDPADFEAALATADHAVEAGLAADAGDQAAALFAYVMAGGAARGNRNPLRALVGDLVRH